jgi:hypothetical protein
MKATSLCKNKNYKTLFEKDRNGFLDTACVDSRFIMEFKHRNLN